MSHSILVAPFTTPTTLYRFAKKVTQSFNVPFSLSSISCQSALTSSALVDVLPRARDASLPAKTSLLLLAQKGRGLELEMCCHSAALRGPELQTSRRTVV